jgi:hypothetical protein
MADDDIAEEAGVGLLDDGYEVRAGLGVVVALEAY